MDTSLLEALGTIGFLIAFAGVMWWTFSKRQTSRFDQASQLPFDDEDDHNRSTK